MLALWSLLADSFVLDCRVTFHFLPVYLPTSIVLLVVGERLKYFVLWLPFLVFENRLSEFAANKLFIVSGLDSTGARVLSSPMR